MPLFKYQAMIASGKKTSGFIEADSLVSAKENLRLQNMIITALLPYEHPRKKKKLPAASLLDITRMLSQLLHAGIPLYEALVIIEEKYKTPLLLDLCDRVKKGESLSSSLSHYKEVFDPIYISMVRAGQESGSLARSFEELSQLLQDKSRLKKQLVSATAYPLFLGSFCIVVFISLLCWVIPSLKNLFEGRALHPLTQFVFALSDLFLHHSLLIFTTAALALSLLFITIVHPRLKTFWNKFILKLPLIGPLVLLAATVRFCRTCSLLIEGGTPLLQALQLTRSILKNHTLECAFIQIEKNVSEGEPLSQQIEKQHLMPPIVSRMLAVGEKTGQSASMLKQIATLCEEDLTRTLQRYTTLLQPLLLIILGLLIGIVVLSILIPLTDVGSVL